MRYLRVILLVALSFTCGSARVFSAPPPFSIVPPIADANPSVRHPLSVQIPIGFRCEQHGNQLVVSESGLENTNLMVGRNMAVGMISEDFIYRNGVKEPSGGCIQSAISVADQTNSLTLGQNGMPPPGQRFTFERQVTIFETDVPPQHMWDPESGKYYKVLWSATANRAVR